MRLFGRTTMGVASAVLTVAATLTLTPVFAQPGPPQDAGQPGPPPQFLPPPDLDRLVSRIALYPDSLLAQVLAAATYPDQIPEAARWADEHGYLKGDDLARAISEDHLWWDPSVQALLPFPSVLDMMARDPEWTGQVGNAFLAQRDQVMDAVQRMRQRASEYGYLRSNGQIQVIASGPGAIEIVPVNPAFFFVPVYDPLIVFAPPRPGFRIGAAISFGPGIMIGAGFAPWGWGAVHFDWFRHSVFINNHEWGRGWVNRGAYVHPYSVPRYRVEHRQEHHELRGRERR
jgi:hypothetical protein